MSNVTFSQEKQMNNPLLKVYSEIELTLIQENEPLKYDLLVYAIDHAVYVIDFPKGKDVSIPNTISLPNTNSSFLDLNLKIKDENQYFLIKGSDKVLVIKSFFVLKNEIKTKK